MSQSILGQHLGGISYQAVTKIETDHIRMSTERLVQVVAIFNKPLTFFEPPEWTDFEAHDLYRQIKPELQSFAKSLLRFHEGVADAVLPGNIKVLFLQQGEPEKWKAVVGGQGSRKPQPPRPPPRE